MRILYLLLTIILLKSNILEAQIISLKGVVTDTASNRSLSNTSVSLLKKIDSTLVNFTRTDEAGKFTFDQLNPGNYLLLITNPLYGDYVDIIDLKENVPTDFLRIPLTEKTTLLKEIIVRAQAAAIRQKGDTTEYAADSFKVKPNATVEDLLKKMPGIQVDKNGQVTAQGQKVEKILVDGEEFFSDDPTVATKNIRADAVDKVQVFDKKSEQATFTGIEDGQKTKTVNLKLKEDKKKGYFGKLSAGALEKYHTGEAMINVFRTKQKFAAFAITSNTDRTGLNWQDEKNYGSGSNDMVSFSDDGGSMMVFSGGQGDEFGGQNYFGQGLPESFKAGIHFSEKWKQDQYNVNGNYRFNKLNEMSAGSTFRKNILKDSIYYDQESGKSSSAKLKHSVNGSFEMQLDSSSSIKITANGTIGTTRSNSFLSTQALSQENSLVNTGNRNSSLSGNNGSLNSNIIWRKKFRKKGRTLSVSADEKYKSASGSGFLYSLSSFYKGPLNFKTDTIDQKKINDNKGLSLSIKFSYTEPLSKKSILELNYSITKNSSNLEKLTYSNTNNYSKYLDSLSNSFRYDIITNSVGANYRYNSKKYYFGIGTNLTNTSFTQSDLVVDTILKYHYINLYPRANIGYRFTQYSALNLNYNGNSRQPTIEQIQPIRENSNPLNLVVGNPDLKQEFRHNISLNFNDFKILNQRSIFMSVNYTKVDNGISNEYSVDTLGKRINKAVNVDGNYTLSSYLYYSMKIPRTKFRINFNPNVNFSHNTNYVNKEKNTTLTKAYSFGTGINITKDNKYELSISPTISYSTNSSSISLGNNSDYWSFEQGINGSYILPFKMEIGTNLSYNYREKISIYDKNNSVIVWNAYLEKKILKKEALVMKFSVNDILNQNQGYSNSVTATTIEERHYTTFMRYALFTLSWNFTNNGSPSKSPF